MTFIPMPLSQAIREGAKLRKKNVRGFFARRGKNKEIASCALGAAYERITGEVALNQPEKVREVLKTAYPALSEGLGHTITLWNDIGVSREEIADRLEAKGQ